MYVCGISHIRSAVFWDRWGCWSIWRAAVWCHKIFHPQAGPFKQWWTEAHWLQYILVFYNMMPCVSLPSVLTNMWIVEWSGSARKVLCKFLSKHFTWYLTPKHRKARQTKCIVTKFPFVGSVDSCVLSNIFALWMSHRGNPSWAEPNLYAKNGRSEV